MYSQRDTTCDISYQCAFDSAQINIVKSSCGEDILTANTEEVLTSGNVFREKSRLAKMLKQLKRNTGMAVATPPSAIEEFNSGPNQALLERISILEAQLARYANVAAPIPSSATSNPELSPTLSQNETANNRTIADIVGFLSLGGEAAYVGSSSGFSLATNLGQMVQATIWNKALESTVNQTQSKSLCIAELKKNSAGPPNNSMGDRILEAYLTRVHLRYPFLDRSDIIERHCNRFVPNHTNFKDQFGTFKIYMIYAIALVPKISPTLELLEDWHRALPGSSPYESDYLNMHYYKAVRLLLQPFLTILPATDERVALCLQASGQICQIFKRLHQRGSYGHSFIALHSTFIAGVTMCFCLFRAPSLWTSIVSNDLRACSSALFVMAERRPVVKKYRDALENIIGETMEFLARPPSDAGQGPDLTLPTPVQHATKSEMSSGTIPDSTVFTSAAQESYVGEAPKAHVNQIKTALAEDKNLEKKAFDYAPQAQTTSPDAENRWEGRHRESGQIDAEWMLSLCEGDGFDLRMLNEMMRFEPSLEA
ncbi:hypothetical protein JHW43_002312 [Diplocarpon mali]|nr:hypothetical protein JHW43_002312 [Diplocarpon mali]